MNTVLKYLFAIISLLVGLNVSCERNNKSDCSNLLCSAIFKYITIQIKQHSDSSAVVLTDYKVIRISDNMDITIHENVINHTKGYYPIVSDAELTFLRNSFVEVEFQGYINERLIIDKYFTVSSDCCHVTLVSGDPLIYI
jgi:alkyl sulfatase BDS1-like metallo-beta-lactamase superfamily hydrolase